MANNFDSLIFDLDGTLWDASSTIAESWNQVCKDLNLDFQFTDGNIRSISGLPFEKCVEVLFEGLTPSLELKNQLSNSEKEFILKKGGDLYPGALEGLSTLSSRYKIFLVSNCQDWYLQAFLERFNLQDAFQDTAYFGKWGSSKADNIRSLIQKYDLKRALYIGDTHWDQHAAYFAGAKFLFAKYGFGSVNHKRCLSVDSFSELVDFLMKPGQAAPALEFRKLLPADFEAAQKLYRAAAYTQDLDPENIYYGAFHDANLVGIVRLATEEGVSVLRGMQINPHYQFFGIGTKLLRMLEKDLGHADCFCIPYSWLGKFYGQIGFKPLMEKDSFPDFLKRRLDKYLKDFPEMMLMKRSHEI